MVEKKEFHINKENFDEVIQHIPFGLGTLVIFDDEESYVKFHEIAEMVYSEQVRKLIITEIYMKCFHNGYFATFKDCFLNYEIFIENPEYSNKSAFKGTTKLGAGIENTDEEGRIDVTELAEYFFEQKKENPNNKVKLFVTSWSRKYHFNKKLLSTPIPNEMFKIFVEKKV